jgi:hypothetical protein
MRFKAFHSVYIAFVATLLLTSSCSFNNFEDLKPAVGPCDTVQVSFATDIIPIMERNCSNQSFNNFNGDCHQSGSPIADYTIYAGVKAKVDEGKLEQRALIEKTMPPTFSNGPRPDSTELQMIMCWIESGAPDN